MSKTIAILQPGYLPWCGFFEQMAYADLFVYLDDVQYTRKDWRSRNQIKINGQAHWLTVPVKKMPLETRLRDIEIADEQEWRQKHLSSIRLAYCNTPFFEPLFGEIEKVITKGHRYLWELDVDITAVLAGYLGIKTPVAYASDVPRQALDKNHRIVELCEHFGGVCLYDGKAAADFIDVSMFKAHGVNVIFQDYHHPVYAQGRGEFLPYMSVIDLLFRTGEKAADILLSSPNPFAKKGAA